MKSYENALIDVAAANDGVGLAKVTSYIEDVFESKEATDYLNTNVNHGNDFCSRIIAGGILAAMAPAQETPEEPDTPEEIAGDLNGDSSVNLKDLIALAQLAADWNNIIYNRNALDVNGDNIFDLSDVQYLAKHLAGWEGYEPQLNAYLPDSELPNQSDTSTDDSNNDVDIDVDEKN